MSAREGGIGITCGRDALRALVFGSDRKRTRTRLDAPVRPCVLRAQQQPEEEGTAAEAVDLVGVLVNCEAMSGVGDPSGRRGDVCDLGRKEELHCVGLP